MNVGTLRLRRTARHGLCGFEYLTIKKQQTDRSRSVVSGGDGGTRSFALLRFVRLLCKPFAFICPSRSAYGEPLDTDYAVSSTLKLNKKQQTDKSRSVVFGGDGGTRNRVRKSLLATFYERSHYIVFPSAKRLMTGFGLR